MDETCSLVYRLHERYLDDGDEQMDNDLFMANFSISPCKMATDGGLELMVLNHMNISHIGDVSRFANIVSNVVEADLAWNSISDWETVGIMLNHLPHLQSLNLSHNPLSKNIKDAQIPLLPRLRVLALNGTHLPFSVLQVLMSRMPNLRELHISDNQLSLDEPCPKLSDSVIFVHLNRCSLQCWTEVAKILRALPVVKTAFLVENPIKTVKHEGSVEELSSLNKINISKTDISDWESIDSLSQLPGLVDLRITNVPLFEGFSEEERHHLMISRMENLRVINGSDVTPEQRETSERFFIRYYQDRDEKPSHYKRLVEKHGELEKLAKVDLTPKNSCTVEVVCEETDYAQKLNINLEKTVGQLMKSLEKLIKIRYVRMRMFHTNVDGQTNECRYHNNPLYFLRIEDGDKLTIQSKIVHTRRRPLTQSPP